MFKLGHGAHRPKFVRWKRSAWDQLACRINECAGRMIHDDQFRFIKVEYFSKFFGYSKFVMAILRQNFLVVSQGEKLFRVGVGITHFAHRQAEWRSAKDVGHELE